MITKTGREASRPKTQTKKHAQCTNKAWTKHEKCSSSIMMRTCKNLQWLYLNQINALPVKNTQTHTHCQSKTRTLFASAYPPPSVQWMWCDVCGQSEKKNIRRDSNTKNKQKHKKHKKQRKRRKKRNHWPSNEEYRSGTLHCSKKTFNKRK